MDKRIRKRSKHLNEPEILANMYEEELKLLPLLEEKGRNVLPDSKRKIHRQIVGRRIEAKGEPNSSIDRFEVEPNTSELKLFQRRFYDSDGKAEQDFDYKHQSELETHLFPHIHVWINGKRRDTVKYR